MPTPLPAPDSRQGHVTEPTRQLPVRGRFDVVVAGGGIAGVAAAVAAARNGASVCLLERFCALGGLATLGNVTVWLPICDGEGRQVIAGLPEELLKLSVAKLQSDHPSPRFSRIPACWQPDGDPDERRKTRYRVNFNPSAYMLALEKFLLDEGVSLLYDTRVCALDRVNGVIRHLIVENKSGRGAIACGCVVDATGDADIGYLAQERTESLSTNVLCGWFYTLNPNGTRLHTLSNRYSPKADTEGAQGPFFRGDDGEAVTEFLIGSRQKLRERLDDWQQQAPADDIQVFNPPTLPCFRMTRRLVTACEPAPADVHHLCDDRIGLTGDWRHAGPVYAIPWRSLCAEQTRNLLAAGRCISVDNQLWDVTRAIPACAMTGEAAGTAAALSALSLDGDTHRIDIEALQQTLRRQGVILNPTEKQRST